jgi:hypothetical protein
MILPRQRHHSPAASLASLPYRRSNQSLSKLFESTTSISTSRPNSGTATPTPSTVPGSVFSPGSRLSGTGTSNSLPPGVSDEYRTLIQRAFVPCVAVLADAQTEELIRGKGLEGGLLQLLRPFGETVPGKVTIRDSNGASKSWEDFGVRFIGVDDAYPDLRVDTGGQRTSTSSVRRPRRAGGDVSQIEELVDRHLQYSEFNRQDPVSDYMNKGEAPAAQTDSTASPFHTLYLRRLLSGLPVVPHETFSHPVAGIIAISSRNPHPIEELRRLYNRQHDGDLRFPQWVENDFLRYYVLIHDEETGDIAKSNQTFDSMKRHFGLHCHLLRLKSQQCIASDDDSVRLPTCEWMSASEELAEIQRRGKSRTLTYQHHTQLLTTRDRDNRRNRPHPLLPRLRYFLSANLPPRTSNAVHNPQHGALRQHLERADPLPAPRPLGPFHVVIQTLESLSQHAYILLPFLLLLQLRQLTGFLPTRCARSADAEISGLLLHATGLETGTKHV